MLQRVEKLFRHAEDAESKPRPFAYSVIAFAKAAKSAMERVSPRTPD